MRTTTIFAETHTSERANHVAYRLVAMLICLEIDVSACTDLASFRYLAANCMNTYLCNRLPVGGGYVYVLQLFFVVFFVFFRPSKIWDNRSRERLNGFSWNFHQTIGGNVVWNVVPPLGESRAAAWRTANVDALRNLRYDSCGITRGRHRRLRYTTRGRIDVI